MRYRILFNGAVYRVQYKGLFFWSTLGGGGEYFIPWDFKTEEEAEEGIRQHFNVHLILQRFHVHKELEARP